MNQKSLTKILLLVLCVFVGSFLAACGGGGSGGGSGATQGTLSTSLTDASTDAYQAVYVTVARVEVHSDGGGGWQTVASPDKTYNLLKLVNGVRETLGFTTLNAGHYTQMRLVLSPTPDSGINIFSPPHPYANYVIDQNDAVHELTVPSGMTTGLKLVNGFDINADQTTELILDFDAMHSVVIAGSSGKYQLKPTVKVLDTADGAVVSGIVSEVGAAPSILLGGAIVTAQVAAPGSADARDQVVIEAGTLSAADGGYALFLAPGGYNLVATASGYLLACTAVSLPPNSLTMADFALDPAPAEPGSITGNVSVAGASADQVVTIDFRQEITCDGASAPAMITVKSINVANGGTFDVALPEGNYQVVASTFGKTTQVVDNLTVTTAAATDLGDIAF